MIQMLAQGNKAELDLPRIRTQSQAGQPTALQYHD